jgi:hypothetical protein
MNQPIWHIFFDNNIKGYLLGDLEEMNKIKVEGPGNCGYPMLMTMLSGMELLGGLTNTDPIWHKDGSHSGPYFYYYFEKYFQDKNTAYPSRKEDFWKLLRHKLAHTFLTAMHFRVTKNLYEDPIVTHGNLTDIDVGILFKDFKTSVLQLEVELKSDSALSSRFENHLSNIITAYTSSSSSSVSTTHSVMTMTSSADYSSLATTAIPQDIQQQFNSSQSNASSPVQP